MATTLQPTTTKKRKSSSKDDDVYQIPYEGQLLTCDRVTRILGATKSQPGLLRYYGDKGTTEAERYRDETGQVGKAVHALIEQHLTGKPPDPDLPVSSANVIRRFGHFLDWEKAHKIQVAPGYRCAEHTVFSVFALVAGTLDLHLLVDSTERVYDTKTGKTLKRDHAAQTAIYALMEREGRARAMQDLEALEMLERFWEKLEPPKIDWPKMGILHIPIEGLFEWEINPDEAVAHALDFARRLKSFRHDQTCRPFRRAWPEAEEKWLRAS